MSPQFTRDNEAAADVLKAARGRLKSERGLTLHSVIFADTRRYEDGIAYDAVLRELGRVRGGRPASTWDRIAATCRAERKLRGMG